MPNSTARSNFAERLKAARLAAGFTQQQLGVLIGLPEEVASTRINRYERAVHDCDLETARRLADALRLPLPSLYAETAVMSEAIKLLSSLSDIEITALLSDLARRA